MDRRDVLANLVTFPLIAEGPVKRVPHPMFHAANAKEVAKFGGIGPRSSLRRYHIFDLQTRLSTCLEQIRQYAFHGKFRADFISAIFTKAENQALVNELVKLGYDAHVENYSAPSLAKAVPWIVVKWE